jgi:hypothetical protein
MKTSIHSTQLAKPSGRTILKALAVGFLISGLSISPAFADRDHDRGHDARGGHDHGRRGDRDWHDRGWHGDVGVYGYAQPVYVPPPVYVQPYQSPGISLILPIHIR